MQQGHLCPKCGKQTGAQKIRLRENHVRDFLIQRRINLVGSYRNGKSPLCLRCDVCNNEWLMRFNSIQQGQGCPKCGVRRRADSQRFSETRVRQFFAQRGITLLEAYVGSEKPVACQCDKCSYKWFPTYASIRRGQGCPKCKNHAPLTQTDYEELAQKNNGQIIKRAKTGRDLSTWKCARSHVFKQSYDNVKNRKSFCAVCSGRKRKTLKDYQILAAKYGGKIKLMGKTAQINSIWVCRHSHEFPRSYTDIKTDDSFCPICNRGLAERQCKAALEQIFRVPFKKVKLKQLRGTGGGMLELDLYNDDLKLALEHNGLQHYKPVRFGHQTREQAQEQFRRQQLHDQLRRDYCCKHGIALIEIKDLGTCTPLDQLKKIIGKVCLQHDLRLPDDFDEIQIDLRSTAIRTNEEEMLGRIKRKAKEKGFRLLSQAYLGSQVPHEFVCKNNHLFTKRPYALFIGQGCKECYEQSRTRAS